MFPELNTAELQKQTETLNQTALDYGEYPACVFKDFLKEVEEKYTFTLRPDAKKKAKQFITKAIAVCREYEIGTEITKHEHAINVNMFLSDVFYSGPIKHDLETLIVFADEFSMLNYIDKPNFICLSMTYYTHDLYRSGELISW